MKLSKYIEGLQQFLDNNGDLDVYYSSDDEGNAFYEMGWHSGSLYYLPESEVDNYQKSLVSSQDSVYISELQEDNQELTPVCVVN